MISLGFDPSLTGFGWCIHDSSKVGPERIIARGHYATDPHQAFVLRYIEIRKFLHGLIHKYNENPDNSKKKITVVGVESPPFGELWSEGLYGLFLYVCEVIYNKRLDVVFFDPTTLKYLVKMDPKVIRGKMEKSDMVEFARKDSGVLTGKFDHNEADAYHLARFAARFFGLRHGQFKEEDLTPSEMHVFCRTHEYKRGDKVGKTERKGLVYRENDRFFEFSLRNVEERHLDGRQKKESRAEEDQRQERRGPRSNQGTHQEGRKARQRSTCVLDKAAHTKR
jgi:hypothetical protein